MRLLLLCAVVISGAALAPAAETRRLDGELITLAPGVTDSSFVIGTKGATFHAEEPATFTGTMALERLGDGGLTASVVAKSLRGVNQDDWRTTQTIAGTRHDPQIDFPTQACGTPADRARFGISGSDTDWDNFSIQWDGWLRVFADGTDLATSSDDGSRMWLDRNGDGKVQPDEWGSNGWGDGQGTTQRTVHHGVAAGTYRIRVQYEEGGGGNSMRMLWNDHTHGTVVGEPWRIIPLDGLTPAALVAFDGPVTLAGTITGPGTVSCGDGVRVGGTLAVETLRITDMVTLTGDLNPTTTLLDLGTGSRLDLAGHQLTVPRLGGDGTIALNHGRVILSAGSWSATINGPGELVATGAVRLGGLGDDVRISGGPVRTPERCIARIPLAAPLTTVLPVTEDGSGGRTLEAVIDVPTDAPAGLGVGAWRADRQGRWFQQVHPQRLGPGRHTLRFTLDAEAVLGPEGHRGRWSADAAVGADRVGLFLFADVPSVAPIGVDARLLPIAAPGVGGSPRLTDLQLDGVATDGIHARTGIRWSLGVRPDPYPANPFDPAEFTLELRVTQPNGVVRIFNGFHDEPVQPVDRGDREEFVSTGPASFRVRYRPGQAGRHQLQLTARWRDGRTVVMALPDMLATGAPWDDIVRVDEKDPRFFSAGGKFVWPAGCNLNSTYDVRSRGALQTLLTPDRGSFTREALLARLAAGGGTGCETWLSPWNLGLEWISDWPGFRGTGRYHMGHAWAFDQFLDQAEKLGIRVNVSLFNHGMARDGGGAEEDWRYHPYNKTNGGWLDIPAGLFNDDRAFAQQKQLFRYLAARYGDSPALLGWKLWAEVNLAHAPHDDVVSWHGRASLALHEVDPWNHPVTTHWCGDWHNADLEILALPGMNYGTIDAYHGNETAIAELLNASTRDPLRRSQGLLKTGKPTLVTEFGGSAGGTSQQRMEAEYVIGPWAGLVSGHAGSPMLWWFEWLDQGDRFGIYGAVNRYLAGEDLRGVDAQCVAPQTQGGELWCRAWSRPGRMLGYLLDREWGMNGGPGHPITGSSIVISDDAKSGTVHLEWWDADHGKVIAEQTLTHPGGRLAVTVPEFSRHLAFKLWRTP